MICSDEHLSPGFVHGLAEQAQTVIQGFHGLDRRLKLAAVPYHVPIRVVTDDHIEALALKGSDQLLSDLVSAHGRGEIIGLYLWGGNEDALLSGVGFFSATGEEEGHVGIFFGFRNA